MKERISPVNSEREALEAAASVPVPVRLDGFNPAADIPYGCTTQDIFQAMTAFIAFLRVVDTELHRQGMHRLESLLMPANFSSVVSEFEAVTIPKYCATLARNAYHNGHPDLLPRGRYPGNAAQYAHEGIEVKASRYLRGWQGHNAEATWLMVFVFDSNCPSDAERGIAPKPFRFIKVVGARLEREDWIFSGRSETSRRTITASVGPAGYAKMEANWIYRDLDAATPSDAQEEPASAQLDE